MSRLIDLCDDSDDNGEQPITASLPSLPLSKKRPRDKEESSDDAHPRNENVPTDKNAPGSAEFVVDLELVDEVEVSPAHNKQRRGVLKSELCVKNYAAGKCAQIDSDGAHVADHPESHEGIAAAASHPMNSDVEHASPDDGSKNEFSQNGSTSKVPGRQFNVSAWEDRLSELTEYRKIHGHCNVPQRCTEYPKLANWVTYQRRQYKGNFKGKTSHMTLSRIQELESLGFDWGVCATAWEDRLSELAEYRTIYGHCKVPRSYSENAKLAMWVGTQRTHYRLHASGMKSSMTTLRIQQLESLGFEWDSHGVTWEDRLNELADYRIGHGHCNVPQHCSENTKLAKWVGKQRCHYRLYLKGVSSPMTTFRIQELESLGFEWDNQCANWEARLSELADYRNINGHCNVPGIYSENTKLANWVAYQKRQYRLHLKGKPSHLTLSRIQALENLGLNGTAPAARGKTG
jgi:hypothetical protein